MISRVLLAVDDSPAALAATAAAVDLAAACGAQLRAVTVVANHRVTDLLRAGADPALQERREQAAATVLRHAARVADRSAVPVETSPLSGEPAPRILEEARSWSADLIVMGRASPTGAGQPYVGGQTRHVLEFADVPVMVVPPGRR